MKKDITSQIMQRVTTYEKHQVRRWVLWTIAIGGFLFSAIVVFSSQIVGQLNSLGSWDMLALFTEDIELIRDYWLDTLGSFLEEVPRELAIVVLVLIIIFTLWVVKTANRRRIMINKIRSLSRYSKIVHQPEGGNMTKILAVIGVVIFLFGGLYLMNREKIGVSDIQGSIMDQISPTIHSQEVDPSSIGSTDIPSPGLTLYIDNPTNGQTVTNAVIVLKGRTSPQAEVFVNDIDSIADASGKFSVMLTLEEGENFILIVANDAQGNNIEKEISVIYTPDQ